MFKYDCVFFKCWELIYDWDLEDFGDIEFCKFY